MDMIDLVALVVIFALIAIPYYIYKEGQRKDGLLENAVPEVEPTLGFFSESNITKESDSGDTPVHEIIDAYPIRTPTCGHSLDSFFYYWCSERDFAKSGYENYHIFKRDWFYGAYSREGSDSPIFTPRMPGKTIEYPSDEKALDLGRVDFIEGKSPCVLQEPVCFNPLCKACVSSKTSRERFLRYYMHGYNSARNAVGL